MAGLMRSPTRGSMQIRTLCSGRSRRCRLAGLGLTLAVFLAVLAAAARGMETPQGELTAFGLAARSPIPTSQS